MFSVQSEDSHNTVKGMPPRGGAFVARVKDATAEFVLPHFA